MLLYIGNKLSKHGINPTGVEYLGERLAQDYDIITVSDKKNKLLRLLDMLFTIFKYRKKTSLVIIDTYSTLNFLFAWYSSCLARWFRIPYIPVLRGGDLENRLKKSPEKCRILFGNAYQNVAPSKFLKAKADQYQIDALYIPNFIDINNYPFKERKAVQPKLLYVRSLDKIYNPAMALKAVAMLKKDLPDVQLCLVGPDKDNSLDKLKQLAKELGIEKNVTFKGRLTKEEWIGLSINYDLFINPTNFDNMPVSVIEAMALGFPIVSTNVGGLPYLIEHEKDGLLIPKGDAEAMANAIKSLIDNPVLAGQLSANARKKAETFDWENVKQQWINLIDNALNK